MSQKERKNSTKFILLVMDAVGTNWTAQLSRGLLLPLSFLSAKQREIYYYRLSVVSIRFMWSDCKNLNGLSQQTLCPQSGALTFCIIRIESNNKELQQSCRQWIDCARGVVTACGNSLFIRQKIGMQLCTYNLMNARHRSTAAAAAGAHCAI